MGFEDKLAYTYFNKLVEKGVEELCKKYRVNKDTFYGMVMDMHDGGTGLLDDYNNLVDSCIKETEKKFNVIAIEDYYESKEEEEGPYWYKFEKVI